MERKGILPNGESSKGVIKSVYRAVLPGLYLVLANYLISFLTPDLF